MTNAKCGSGLTGLPNQVPTGEVLFCECGCHRMWELRERTRWITYRPWLKTVPANDGSRVWVRLSKPLSLQVMAIQERQ